MISLILKTKNIVMILALAGISLSTAAQSHQFDPPWNEPPKSAVNFTVKGIDNLPDIYGDINDPQLVIFIGGNQFMVLGELCQHLKRNTRKSSVSLWKPFHRVFYLNKLRVAH